MSEFFDRQLNRRQILIRTALGGAALMAAPLIAACGASGSSAPAAITPANGSLTADEATTIAKMLGSMDAKYAGAGQTWNIGAAFPLSGPANYYGTIYSHAMSLARSHIEALGGPTINISYQDIGTVTGTDPQKGVNATIALHDAKLGAVMSMGYNDNGAMNPWVAQYQIFSLDPGGGVGAFPSKPYFWGMRADNPASNVRVALQYVKAKMPKLKGGTLIFWSGPAYTATIQRMKDGASAAGLPFKSVITTNTGAADYSATLAQLRSENPDFILLALTASDYANFMKQYVNSGIGKPVFAVAFSGPAQKVAGAAFNGMYFAQEDFTPDQPSNKWAAIFAKYYRKSWSDQGAAAVTPLNLEAAYYSGMFTFWDLYRRVRANGGDPNDGSQLQTALQTKPVFPSLFGGANDTAGTVEFDTTTHGLKSEPFGVYQVQSNGVPKRLAHGDSGGSTLKFD
jgi:ABC-type branched-subunit amino acid transport system substrate-binding protein